MTDLHPENALLGAWEKTRKERGATPAIFATNGSVLRTFDAIEEEARQLASLVAPFSSGSVIAVQIGNSPSWPAVLLSLFRASLIPLPLGRHMEAVERALALSSCRAAGLVIVEHGQLRLERGAEIQMTRTRWDNPVPHLLKLTSGTTSAPRAIRFRADQLLSDCVNICETMGVTRDDLNFGVVPFSHSYGFSNLLTPLLAYGVPLVASDDRMPRAILNDLAATRATVFPGMPVFYQNFVALENVPELPSLRLCISAGAPLAINVAARFTSKFGRKIHTFYGASECGGIAYDSSAHVTYEDGFIGTPMRHVDVKPTDASIPSTITVRSDAVGDGYYPLADLTVLGSGRFVPSDLIRIGERGMYIAGRASEIINVAGRKLNPIEVEKQILQCEGVRQAVVFGIASSLRGEEPVACVVAEPSLEPAALLRFCQAQLSAWQLPKDYWFVDEIPVTERGKISRRTLAELYALHHRAESQRNTSG